MSDRYAGDIQMLVNAAGDIVAKLSQSQEQMQNYIEKWNNDAAELDQKLAEVKEALRSKGVLTEEIDALEKKKAGLEAALGQLMNAVHGLDKR